MDCGWRGWIALRNYQSGRASVLGGMDFVGIVGWAAATAQSQVPARAAPIFAFFGFAVAAPRVPPVVVAVVVVAAVAPFLPVFVLII